MKKPNLAGEQPKTLLRNRHFCETEYVDTDFFWMVHYSYFHLSHAAFTGHSFNVWYYSEDRVLSVTWRRQIWWMNASWRRHGPINTWHFACIKWSGKHERVFLFLLTFNASLMNNRERISKAFDLQQRLRKAIAVMLSSPSTGWVRYDCANGSRNFLNKH